VGRRAVSIPATRRVRAAVAGIRVGLPIRGTARRGSEAGLRGGVFRHARLALPARRWRSAVWGTRFNNGDAGLAAGRFNFLQSNIPTILEAGQSEGYPLAERIRASTQEQAAPTGLILLGRNLCRPGTSGAPAAAREKWGLCHCRGYGGDCGPAQAPRWGARSSHVWAKAKMESASRRAGALPQGRRLQTMMMGKNASLNEEFTGTARPAPFLASTKRGPTKGSGSVRNARCAPTFHRGDLRSGR